MKMFCNHETSVKMECEWQLLTVSDFMAMTQPQGLTACARPEGLSCLTSCHSSRE